MTTARRAHSPQTIFMPQDCLERAVTNLAIAEDQLAAREARFADAGWQLDAPHIRNRIELGSAWSLVAEALIERDRP